MSALGLAGTTAVVATDGGIALLERQMWTLAQKAEHYETILTRHDRVGPCKSGNTKRENCITILLSEWTPLPLPLPPLLS